MWPLGDVTSALWDTSREDVEASGTSGQSQDATRAQKAVEYHTSSHARIIPHAARQMLRKWTADMHRLHLGHTCIDVVA